MKKYLYLAAALLAGTTLFTSCSNDDDEEKVELRTLTFETSAFDALIDNPQYGGKLLYGENAVIPDYSWTDTDNTLLSGCLSKTWGGTYGFAEGGVAVSNYIDANIKEHANYQNQLAIPATNGSKNFAVVFCDASISFSDSISRVIRAMQVSPTTYELGCITYGDGYAASLAESGELTVDIEGFNGATSTGHVKVDMAKGGNLLTTWKTVDLTSLGKVTKLAFTMTGTDYSNPEKPNASNIKSPKYFAFDNVVVEFEK